MKGIILAGGKGTRLYPMTKAVSKQLLPLYDKPMIYYPLSVLFLAKISEILIISTRDAIEQYKSLLGDGSEYGVHFEYVIQETPRGLADAFILGEKFIGDDSVCLVLGDNVFYGDSLTRSLENAKEQVKQGNGVVFGYPVKDASAFGVVEFDKDGRVVSIEEKPEHPKSNFAVPGLYMYPNSVVEIAKNVIPSKRGEIEITSINNAYLKKNQLKVNLLGRGMAWLDTGTPKGMLKAAEFIEAVQSRQGFYIACLEEIAYRRGLIDYDTLQHLGENLKMTEYGQYILSITKDEK